MLKLTRYFIDAHFLRSYSDMSVRARIKRFGQWYQHVVNCRCWARA